jgi:hypothetical protein
MGSLPWLGLECTCGSGSAWGYRADVGNAAGSLCSRRGLTPIGSSTGCSYSIRISRWCVFPLIRTSCCAFTFVLIAYGEPQSPCAGHEAHASQFKEPSIDAHKRRGCPASVSWGVFRGPAGSRSCILSQAFRVDGFASHRWTPNPSTSCLSCPHHPRAGTDTSG